MREVASVHKIYEFDYSSGTVKLKNKKCPRCGSVMAYHKQPEERYHCGKCGYTEFVRARRKGGRGKG
ncbi:MAG: 30S ribosomal protein S27ae [Thermofilaceae archaeon]